ncbi:methyltransferase domain-containing protein [uncultured Shewanella sp.]|uniref:class I SAM-dependent methyltransferase n=1 Tax=uncultured Shewanella sp. TaxID=173975 RepID=UPI00262286B9|nr:methyltransferase domain-containing protein [uncultured Shewanella sp.]
MVNEYVLGVEDSEIQRLRDQECVLNKSSVPYLTQYLCASDRVLEVGSGAGGASQIIAQLLNYSGHLTCIEREKKYVELLTLRMKYNSAGSVRIINADIHDYQTEQRYDKIYLRCVLHHLVNPIDVIRKLKTLLTSNGLLIIEEPNVSDFFTQYTPLAYQKLATAYAKLGESFGVDFNIGIRLFSYMEQADFHVENYQFVQATLQTERERQLSTGLLTSITSGLMSANIMSQNDITLLQKELNTLIHSNALMPYVTMGQIVARNCR